MKYFRLKVLQCDQKVFNFAADLFRGVLFTLYNYSNVKAYGSKKDCIDDIGYTFLWIVIGG